MSIFLIETIKYFLESIKVWTLLNNNYQAMSDEG